MISENSDQYRFSIILHDFLFLFFFCMKLEKKIVLTANRVIMSLRLGVN